MHQYSTATTCITNLQVAKIDTILKGKTQMTIGSTVVEAICLILLMR